MSFRLPPGVKPNVPTTLADFDELKKTAAEIGKLIEGMASNHEKYKAGDGFSEQSFKAQKTRTLEKLHKMTVELHELGIRYKG